MSNNFYPCTCLTGGVGALSLISGSDLADGDAALVGGDGYGAFYQLDADSGLAESLPNIVSPVVNAGDKRWILISTSAPVVSGTQGPQGYTGPQGYQGEIGPQGYQGSQGNQGYQGYQGVEGHQGYQGVPGNQGYQGDAGVNGSQGPQGAAGNQGAQGVTGTEGSQGAAGADGAQGFQGNDGNQGFQGDQGVEGAQGSTGATGAQGSQGNDGTGLTWQGAWVTGSSYVLGDAVTDAGTSYVCILAINPSNTAPASDTTHFSPIALAGAQGAQGATGSTGSQGPQGNVGSQGATGPQGNTGSQGLTGSTGSQGPQGLTGSQGVAGPQGDQGSQGAVGPQGVIGPQGLTGSQGATGPQGTAGSQGATGPQGVIGPQGYVGSQGPTGPQGSAGPQGVTGATGNQGPNGAQGADGTNGSQGAQGDVGPSIRDIARNLLVLTQSAYEMWAKFDSIIVQDNNGMSKKLDNPTSAYFVGDIRNSGAGGLDVGSYSGGEIYYLWIIHDGTTTTCLFSLQDAYPTMPSGYTYKALVSSNYFSSALSSLWDITQKGRIVTLVANVDTTHNITDYPGTTVISSRMAATVVKIRGILSAYGSSKTDLGILLEDGTYTEKAMLRWQGTSGSTTYIEAPYSLISTSGILSARLLASCTGVVTIHGWEYN